MPEMIPQTVATNTTRAVCTRVRAGEGTPGWEPNPRINDHATGYDPVWRAFLLLPTVEKAGFSTLALVLAALLAVSGVIGIAFASATRGRDLEETETAEAQAPRRLRERQPA